VVEQDPRRNGEPDDKPNCGRVDLRMKLVEDRSVMDDKITMGHGDPFLVYAGIETARSAAAQSRRRLQNRYSTCIA
jgi:choline dehydrogenase-like flavoprotein